MSTLPDNDFDLEKLFLPAWAQEEPSSAKYAKYEGPVEPPDRREGRRGPRPQRREGWPGAGREGFGRGPRRHFGGPGGDRRTEGGPGGRGGERDRGPGGRRDQPRERREPPPPLPEVNVSLVPEERGVESLARQIKMTGRAYPLFDIAQMILQKPERHAAVFDIKKNAEGQPVQPLFVCALDDTLWLTEDEAVAHVLRKHFGTFYQTDRTATEPPKGKYTFVAQCGMSGVVLGPPNHHDYQNQLRKLHSERFSRMPFEVYKSRVRIVRDEEVVKKWVDDQSWKTEYVCLNLPEALRLGNMEAVEKHFRETHKENIIKKVESHTLSGTAARNLRSPELVRLVRSVTEDQRRFPLQIATVLSQQFATHGLQFFKVNKTITHVAVARPHYLDLALTPVSEGVKRIVEYIDAHPKTNRRHLVEALAPTPVEPIVVPLPQPAAEGQPAPAPQPAAPTPEQTAVIADLHWLIHQGHVIEFATGLLETAKKPVPKPPKPEPKPKLTETIASEAAGGETQALPPQPPSPEGQVTPAEPAVTTATPAGDAQTSAPEPRPESEAVIAATSEPGVNPAAEEVTAPEPASETPPAETKTEPQMPPPPSSPEEPPAPPAQSPP
ncbi:MAG TPA: hypothetical protein VJA21_02280 [Verrucomicrobiae bacterium]